MPEENSFPISEEEKRRREKLGQQLKYPLDPVSLQIIEDRIRRYGIIKDHGELTGLADDDHTNYLTTTRGDARYYTETELDAGQLDNRYYTETEVDAFAVKLTGNQTVAGIKTFSSFPVTPSSAPTTDYQVANKKYVDDSAEGLDFYGAALPVFNSDDPVANYTVPIHGNLDTRTIALPLSWTKIKESTMATGGTFLIKWHINWNPGLGTIAVQSQVWRNGVAVGTVKNHTATNYDGVESDTVSGWTIGDTLQIYILSSDTGGNVAVNNLRVYGDFGSATAGY